MILKWQSTEKDWNRATVQFWSFEGTPRNEKGENRQYKVRSI